MSDLEGIKRTRAAPLLGPAFLIMWHDITAEGDAEYNLWHTRQHMPERIALPGFLRARRGVNRDLERQAYLTLYEGAELEAFQSEDYQRSLNSPTAWTTGIAPHFRNFLRMSCSVARAGGEGLGGALTTVRCTLNPGATEEEALRAWPAVEEILRTLPSVSAAYVGLARPAFSKQATKETELRPRMTERTFDLVFVVEGIGLAQLQRDEPEIAAAFAQLPVHDPVMQSYDMAYMLMRGPQ